MSSLQQSTKLSADAEEFIPSFLKNAKSSSTTSDSKSPAPSSSQNQFQLSKETSELQHNLSSTFSSQAPPYIPSSKPSHPKNNINPHTKPTYLDSLYDNPGYPYYGRSYPAYGPVWDFKGIYGAPAYNNTLWGNINGMYDDSQPKPLSIGPKTDEEKGIYKMVDRNPDVVRYSLDVFIRFCPDPNTVEDLDLPEGVKAVKAQDPSHKSKKKSKKSKEATYARNPNAWTPSVISKKKEKEDEVIYRKLRALLNMVTPTNFDKIVAQARELKISDENIVRQIVKKAIKELNFSELYVRYIIEISDALYSPSSSKKSIDSSKDSDPKNSREESIKSVSVVFKCVLNNIYSRLSYNVDTLKVEFPDDSLTEAYRWTLIGTCLLIGELYKKKIVSIDLITNVINNLLSKNSVCFFVEVACKLLDRVGLFIEQNEKNGKNIVKEYITRLESHYYRSDLETRFKVYIFNVLEDSVNNWVPRVKETSFKDTKGSTSSGKKNKKGAVPQTVKRNEYPLQKKGSTSSDNSAAVVNSRSIVFDDGSEILAPIQNIRKEILILSMQSNYSIYEDIVNMRSSKEKNKDSKQDTKSEIMSEEKIKKELELIIEEYFSLHDNDELIFCMQELANNNKYTMLIELALYISLDKKDKEREMIVDLIQYLYIYSKCDVEEIVSCLLRIHMDMDEICIDTPKAKDYFSIMLTKLIENNDIKNGVFSQNELKQYLSL